jgi:hypothetical protein
MGGIVEELVKHNNNVRMRLNISTTSKGYYSWDHTAEVSFDPSWPDALAMDELKRISEELEQYAQGRYGMNQDKPKDG